MEQAELTVRLDSRLWIARVSTNYPDTTFRILAALPMFDSAVIVFDCSRPEKSTLTSLLSDLASIGSVEAFDGAADRTLVQVEVTEPWFLYSAQEAGVPLTLPVEISDGRATFVVIASQGRLSTFRTKLEKYDMSIVSKTVQQSSESSNQVLTSRQRDLLAIAAQHGYYETPRGTSLTELADHLEMSKSAVSETLHRAEGALVRAYLTTLDPEHLVAEHRRTSSHSRLLAESPVWE